jgi:23S rRNA pseudouridine1911/1915/1917 synthase
MSEELIQPDKPEELDGEILSHEGDERVGEHLRFRVGHNLKFRRLDRYLCGRFSQFSRSRLQKLIREQGVNVNERPAKPSCALNPGDEIDLILPPRELRELIPEDIPIDVIYEDDHIIVLNKQVDLLVHPARGYKSGTLVNGLVFRYGEILSSGKNPFRPGIVHRLDRNTTGALVVAKTDEAHWKLSRQFADRKTRKTYLTVVHGTPDLDSDCINAPIGINPRHREMCTVRHDGKESVTCYEVLESFRGYSLLQLDLKTGRTHQIRVHMAYIKHPVVADDMYGGKPVYLWQLKDQPAAAEEPIIARVALHAWRLGFTHPITGEAMEFEAPVPADILNLLDALRTWRPRNVDNGRSIRLA